VTSAKLLNNINRRCFALPFPVSGAGGLRQSV